MRRATRRLLPLAAALSLGASGCKDAAPPPAPAVPAQYTVAKSLAAIVASAAAVRGEVQVRRGGEGEWQPVETAAMFRAGDVVRTGTGSFARVEFLSAGGLELEENAQVVIDFAPPEPGAPPPAEGAPRESRVAVEAGVVRGFLPASPDALPLVVRTQDGADVKIAPSAGERPVALRLTRGERGTEVAVTTGEVRVLGAKGESTLRSGQAADLAAAGTGEVAELLEFPASVEPGVDARFRFDPGLAIRLAWKPVDGASGYRVQVARDLSFQTVVRVVDVEALETTFTPPAEGAYAWRVASRDAAGRHGEYGFARRIYCEHEKPQDLLVGPTDGAVVRLSPSTPPVSFTWQSAASAPRYRLVVARGPDLLAQPLLTRETTGQRLEVGGLTPGEYYWGVYADDGTTPAPIFVKARRLAVQKAAKPGVKVPKSIREWGR
jgi:hypothetical protein